MNKLFLIRNPEVFQGEKYLNTNKDYFEGWYFKNSNAEKSISLIPGISINKKEKKAFIQVITNQASYFIDYPIEEFSFSFQPFGVKIGRNTFSKEGIQLDIEDERQKLIVKGNLQYLDRKNIATHFWNPNIMGPFSYLPFMECNHALISMEHKIEGGIQLNDENIEFNVGKGYIEKDWGCSFPKSYIWCQGNQFQKKNASFMLSIANIPFKVLEFQGIICDVMIDNLEFKFTTYHNAKVIKKQIKEDSFFIILKKGDYHLEIISKFDKGLKLTAPVKGKMEKDILESITATITVTLREKNSIIFLDTSSNCGLEIV